MDSVIVREGEPISEFRTVIPSPETFGAHARGLDFM